MKIGNDLVEVKRFYELLTNKRFFERVFTLKEIEHIFMLKNNQKIAERMAGKFAGKEAISKALGLGMCEGVSFSEIEILPDKKGKPTVILYGETKEIFEKMEEKSIDISITNTESMASAVCIFF